MKGITAEKLAKSSRCLLFEDILYLPLALDQDENEALLNYLERKRGIFESRVFQKIYESGVPHLMLSEFLYLAYETETVLAHGREPEWVKDLPDIAKRFLRIEISIRSPLIEPLAIVPYVPYAGFGFIVLEEGFIEEAIRAFGIFRLYGVKQLGFLTDPVVTEGPLQGLSMTFSHTRYNHVLAVAATANLIGLKLGLSESQLKIVKLAGLVHDTLTPAGGDTTKLADPEAFDEDANFPELFSRDKVGKFLEKQNINPSELFEVIQGKGLLGSVLDLADKIGYLAFDVQRYLMKNEIGWMKSYPRSGLRGVAKAARVSKFPLGVWDSVVIDEGRLVFANVLKLAHFLNLRALIIRELYYHPGARFLEFITADVAVKYLYAKGRLTREMLLEMTDDGLERLIYEFLGGFGRGMLFSHEDPRVIEFSDLEAAEATAKRLESHGRICHIEEINHPTKPGTHFLVRKGEKVVAFREAEPEIARMIEKTVKPKKPVRLYHIQKEAFKGNPEFFEALEFAKRYRKGRIA